MSSVIPEGWEEKQLSSITSRVSEKTKFNNQYEVLTSSRSGLFKQSEYFNKKVTSSDNSGYSVIAPGQFTFRAMSDDGTFKFNRSYYSFKGIVSPAYDVFEAKNCIPEFLDYMMNSYEFHKQIYSRAQGGTRLALKYESLSKFKIICPTLPEQKKIVSILTSVDEVIETTQKQIDKLQDLKKAIMNELLTKGIGHTEFKDSELGKIPKGWQIIKLSDINDQSDRYSFTGGPFGSDLKSQDYTKKGVRIIQLQNIGDGQFLNKYKIYTSKEKADELKSCNIFPGDIIISKMGDPVARATIIPAFDTRYLMASDGIRLSINKIKYDIKFILESINHYTVRNQAELSSTGSTRKRIGLVELRKLKIAAPTFSEQKKIASIVKSIDKQIENKEEKLQQTQSLKKSLMQDLLTGKVRAKVN